MNFIPQQQHLPTWWLSADQFWLHARADILMISSLWKLDDEDDDDKEEEVSRSLGEPFKKISNYNQFKIQHSFKKEDSFS